MEITAPCFGESLSKLEQTSSFKLRNSTKHFGLLCLNAKLLLLTHNPVIKTKLQSQMWTVGSKRGKIPEGLQPPDILYFDLKRLYKQWIT